MTLARPSPMSRLTQGDLTAIAAHVGDVVRDVLSKEIPKHFAAAGLAVGTDSDLVAAQQDHAWTRAKRLQETADRAVVRRRIIAWGLSALGAALVLGATAFIHSLK